MSGLNKKPKIDYDAIWDYFEEQEAKEKERASHDYYCRCSKCALKSTFAWHGAEFYCGCPKCKAEDAQTSDRDKKLKIDYDAIWDQIEESDNIAKTITYSEYEKRLKSGYQKSDKYKKGITHICIECDNCGCPVHTRDKKIIRETLTKYICKDLIPITMEYL